MRRKIIMTILVIACTLLQCSVFQFIEIASIKPNLLLIVTVSFGLMRGRKSGLITGFFCGLCCDLFFESILGFYALVYMWIGYLAGYFYRIFYDDDIKTPLLLVSAADLLYTLILTIVTYRLFYAINKKLSKTDKRSTDSLV